MAYQNWTFEIALTTQPDDPNPVYVDFTSRVETANGPFSIVTGDTAETSGAGNSLSLQLNNADQALTPGNVLSPYYPYVKSARKCRVRETIGGVTYDLFTGYIQFPEIEAWTSSSTTAPRDQTITITAVDRLTRLKQAPTFTSTLAEHIRYNGGSDLIGWWPLLNRAQPFLAEGAAQADLTVTDPISVFPASIAGPTGDDASYVRFVPVLRDGIPYPQFDAPVSITVSSTETIAIAIWLNAELPDPAATLDLSQLAWLRKANSLNYIYFRNAYSSGVFDATAGSSGSPGVTFDTVTWPSALASSAWRLVTARLSLATGVIDFWCGADPPVTTTLSGPASSLTFDLLTIGQNYWGSMAHMQIYKGVDAFNRTKHLAQHAMGYQGLERQTTGERIRTVLQYGGVAASDLHNIDDGTSVMQRASLAGKTPADAAFEGSITEQGSLAVDGSGLITFADRRRIYNV